jgi:hypothetical protein
MSPQADDEEMHPVMAARPGHLTYTYRPSISPHDFLTKALAAIKRRRGLIHGSWDSGGRVCALGAFGKAHDGTCIPGDLAAELQQYNDSMPKAAPEVRRAKVIKWIEKRLKDLK